MAEGKGQYVSMAIVNNGYNALFRAPFFQWTVFVLTGGLKRSRGIVSV